MKLAIAAVMLLVSVNNLEAQKRCTKGIPCGNSCIAANKTCRIGAGTATSSGVVQAKPTPLLNVPSPRSTAAVALQLDSTLQSLMTIRLTGTSDFARIDELLKLLEAEILRLRLENLKRTTSR